MQSKRMIWVGVLALATSVSCARESGGSGPVQEHDYFRRLGATLQHSSDLGDRVLAAQFLDMRSQVDAGPSGHVANKAAAKPPVQSLLAELGASTDAVILSIAAQVDIKRKDQAANLRAATQWRKVEPDNLAPLLFAGQSADAVLAAAAGITRYDSHAYGQIRLMVAAFEKNPMSAQEADMPGGSGYTKDRQRATVNAFGVWAAYVIPGYQPLVQACKGDALKSTASRRADCTHLSEVLAYQSDNFLSRGIGMAMLANLADTPTEAAQVAKLRRDRAWQQLQYHQVLSRDMGEVEQVDYMIALMQRPGINTEVQLLEAALREHHVPLDAPADWKAPAT